MDHSKIGNYLALLAFRQTGVKRNLIISGGIFFISLTTLVILGLLDKVAGRSLYLSTALVVIFFISFIASQIKLEIILASIELLNNIREME